MSPRPTRNIFRSTSRLNSGLTSPDLDTLSDQAESNALCQGCGRDLRRPCFPLSPPFGFSALEDGRKRIPAAESCACKRVAALDGAAWPNVHEAVFGAGGTAPRPRKHERRARHDEPRPPKPRATRAGNTAERPRNRTLGTDGWARKPAATATASTIVAVVHLVRVSVPWGCLRRIGPAPMRKLTGETALALHVIIGTPRSDDPAKVRS